METDTTNETQETQKDRLLGDEWLDWKGGAEEYNGELSEPKGLFLSAAFGAALLIILSSFFLYYMISPRLEQLGPAFPKLFGYLTVGFSIILLVGFLLASLSAYTEKLLMPKAIIKKFPIVFLLLPLSIQLGRAFGISKDRMGNSFIKVSNALTKAGRTQDMPNRFIILLPRCLKANIRKEIMDLKEKYKCDIFTATGGDAAREIIRKVRPTAVIGVACERDLMSGIQDVAGKIPVIGIPNKRPEGPCKNTLIDINELEKTIRFCLKK